MVHVSISSNGFDSELFFQALADRTRLRLINLIDGDEVCVCFFVEVLGTNQPKISRHLAYLKRAGLVTTRREGNWMHYRLAQIPDERAGKLFSEVLDFISKDPEMLSDRERMIKICCAPEPPTSVQGAPIPASLATKSCDTTCN